MGFRENLLKKMEIDKMAEAVRKSLGDFDSGVRIDKAVMKKLLQESPYIPETVRDLELYRKNISDAPSQILVLDNDLAFYQTTPEDVALRKSPTIKEMVNIRNAIKILNDKDVIISKKEKSLLTVQKDCLDVLDLSFDRKDIEAMESDGIASFERQYIDGVKEALLLYAEVLGLVPMPKRLRMGHHEIYGKIEVPENGNYRISSVVMYSIVHDKLKLFSDEISGNPPEIAEFLKALSAGQQNSDDEGPDVFKKLTELAMALPKDRSGRFYPKS